MDKFIERYKVPKMTQEEIGNLIRPITRKKIKLVSKTISRKKSPGPDSFSDKV